LTINARADYFVRMATLTIELPTQQKQTAFNLRRWEQLLEDPEVCRIEGRIETDRYGNIVMSPPPAPNHGSFQLEIGYILKTLVQEGRVLTECPISTADGVKASDVAWASAECMRQLGNRSCFPRSPEICVEVLSPRNTEGEIHEKMRLYLDAGAKEVWVCDKAGKMSFFGTDIARLRKSKLCPDFPKRILLS
jgi:Uma2 family endonuclease